MSESKWSARRRGTGPPLMSRPSSMLRSRALPVRFAEVTSAELLSQIATLACRTAPSCGRSRPGHTQNVAAPCNFSNASAASTLSAAFESAAVSRIRSTRTPRSAASRSAVSTLPFVRRETHDDEAASSVFDETFEYLCGLAHRNLVRGWTGPDNFK